MNDEFEFEGFADQPFFFDTEDEAEAARRGRSRAPAARPATAGRQPPARRALTARAPTGGRRPPIRPQPRPSIRIPRHFPIGTTPQPFGNDQSRDCNEQIRWVQNSLNSILSLNLPVDGVMSVETRSAVRSFQQRQNLPVTGIVGPDTQQTLLDATRGAGGNAQPAGDAEPSSTAEPANDAVGDSDGQSPTANELFEFYPEFGLGLSGFGFESMATELNAALRSEGGTPNPRPQTRLTESSRSVLWRRVVTRGLRALDQQQRIGYALNPEAVRRLRCLLRMIIDPRTDDRYINGLGFDFQSVNQRLSASQFNVLISHVRADLGRGGFGPGRSDRQILVELELLDRRIFYGIAFLNRHVATSGAASEPGKVQMKNWMAARQRDRNSVYSCYGGVRS